jgi:AcrR family transcriptional regulator
VGVATVYRYFPTKEALLDASAMVLGDDAKLASLDAYPTTFEEAANLLPDQFAALARQLPLARNQLASPLGRQLRQLRWEAKQAAVARALTASGIDPMSPEGERLAAIIDVLTSSTAVLELHDKAGIPIDVAADHVLWALTVLTRATQEPS